MLTSFHSIIGQEKAKTLLHRGIGQRMGHAYLFRGPAGVGKKSMARAFAAYVNCLAPVNGDICGQCRSCIKYRSGNHPDFLFIEPAGAQIKIAQIRELKKKLAFPPFEAKYRTILIPDIHANLGRAEVANSLLKTLEEPPPNTVLILTGDEAGNILPTILSRCQIIPFYALSYEKVAELLEKDMDPESARTLAAVSEGSLGRARTLQEQDILALRRDIVENLIEIKADHPMAVETVFKLAEKAVKNKDNLNELLDLLTIWLRDLILYKKGSTNLIISQDLAPLLPLARQRWPLDTLFHHLRLLEEARKQLLRNCNRSLVFEVLFFGLL